MQSADRKPPKLVQGPESIHPAGTALVTTTDDESVNTTDTKKTNSTVSMLAYLSIKVQLLGCQIQH